MKIQFIFLVVCVVASFALPQRNDLGNRQQEQREQDDEQQELENTNQGSAIVDDQLTDVRDRNLDEKTNSSNETVTERSKCRNREWRRLNRRYWLRRKEERHRDRSGTELSDEERRDPFIWKESETLSPNENPSAEGHRRHHHHHHHKNRTTTTTPPTTTSSTTLTSESQLSQLEEIATYRHLTAK